MSLKEAHAKFVEEHPNKKISLSKKWAGSPNVKHIPHRVCVSMSFTCCLERAHITPSGIFQVYITSDTKPFQSSLTSQWMPCYKQIHALSSLQVLQVFVFTSHLLTQMHLQESVFYSPLIWSHYFRQFNDIHKLPKTVQWDSCYHKAQLKYLSSMCQCSVGGGTIAVLYSNDHQLE